MVDVFPHGIARYVTSLARGLTRFVSDRPYEVEFLVSSKMSLSDFYGFPVVPARSGFLSPGELLEVPKILKTRGASLYHSPSFSSFFVHKVRGVGRLPCPWIQTLHDLNHLHYGDFSKKVYYRLLLKSFARNASALCTVSRFSQQEISQWLNTAPDSIDIVYNALTEPATQGPIEVQAFLAKNQLSPKGFFFCLSNPKPHKNIPFLLEAYSSYRKKAGATALPLVLSMKGFEQIPGVICLGTLGDEHSSILRSQARAVVFPSLYEGFGLPPVEAAISGTSLIVSDIPPHREGLVDLKPEEVCWIDPRGISTLVQALDEATRKPLLSVSAQSSRAILQHWSEERLACSMDRIYRRVLEKRS